MPICNCQSHGCVNKNLEKRAFNKHQAEDQILWRRQAYERYEKTINKQDESLASEIAALTLSGVTPTASPSSELSRLLPSEKPTHTPSPSPYDELDQIDRELTVTLVDVSQRLQAVGRPSFREHAFPLTEDLLQLRALQSRISRVPASSQSLRSRKEKCTLRLQELLVKMSHASEMWVTRTQEFEPKAPLSNTYDTSHHFDSFLDGVDSIIQISLFTMVALQVVLHLSRRGCGFLLGMIRYIVQLSFYHDRKSISDKKTEFVENFPVDPESAANKFPLDGKETIYAVCPNSKCHKSYAPTYSSKSVIPSYPQFCTYRPFKDSEPCGTALTRKKMYHEIEIQVPIKSYVSFSFKDFVAGLVSRPGFEDLMDNPNLSSVQGVLEDVNDGEFIGTLKEFNNDEPFTSTFHIGRYIFSLSMDFFNPFSNKQAGKKCTVGVISVVCLSLPYTHRYKFENMFLAGVIPGPREPSLTATNHYLAPVIDDFVEFWNPGVVFSRTHNRPEGRTVQCALIIAVCDLLAARKAAGFGACTHEHLCSVCHCTRSRHGYGNTKYETWVRRTNEDIRAASELYRNASTFSAAEAQVKKTGVRWSELLRLPYFDPTRCLVVDTMHNLFLGLLKEHFMNILGIALPVEREEAVVTLDLGPLPSALSKNDGKGVRKLKKVLQAPAAMSLPEDRTLAIDKLTKDVTMKALRFVCGRVECSIPSEDMKPNKATVAGHLLDWRLAQPEVRNPNADTSTGKGHVLHLTDMEKIWKDIRDILTPSWTTSVPSNLGAAGHGKLKSDQWRTLGALHLPLSLIRLWGTVDPTDRRSVRCYQILKVTMSLMSAVIIATSRTTSKDHAAAYLQHMREYIEGVKELFPDYEFLPNHHMALHIHEFLLLFGPVQSWWTFPFERLIGVLQRMPHNFKLGELEATIARAFTRAVNLRALLLKNGCPEVIRNVGTLFRRLVDPQLRNSVQTDIRNLETAAEADDQDEITRPFTTRTLSKDLKDAFAQAGMAGVSAGNFFANTSIKGLAYSTSTKHAGNSCVVLVGSVPARIQYIVQLPSDEKEWYLAVRRHRPSSRRHNPYKQFPILGADLWGLDLEQIEVVSADDVLYHFACLPYDDQNVVVLPLSRSVCL